MALDTNICVGGEYDGKRFSPGRARDWFKIQKEKKYQPGDFSKTDVELNTAEVETETYEQDEFLNLITYQTYRFWRVSTMGKEEAMRRFLSHVLVILKVEEKI